MTITPWPRPRPGSTSRASSTCTRPTRTGPPPCPTCCRRRAMPTPTPCSSPITTRSARAATAGRARTTACSCSWGSRSAPSTATTWRSASTKSCRTPDAPQATSPPPCARPAASGSLPIRSRRVDTCWFRRSPGGSSCRTAGPRSTGPTGPTASSCGASRPMPPRGGARRRRRGGGSAIPRQRSPTARPRITCAGGTSSPSIGACRRSAGSTAMPPGYASGAASARRCRTRAPSHCCART